MTSFDILFAMADVMERVLKSRLTCAGIPLQAWDGCHDAHKYLWVGIGCQRGVSKLVIQQAIESVFTEHDLDLATIAGIATVDRKANEVGLLDYCGELGLFLKTYRLERLNSVIVDRPSPLVSELVGTASVAEAAALCAARTNILLVPKQKFRIGASGSVTLAIAQSDRNLAEIIEKISLKITVNTNNCELCNNPVPVVGYNGCSGAI